MTTNAELLALVEELTEHVEALERAMEDVHANYTAPSSSVSMATGDEDE